MKNRAAEALREIRKITGQNQAEFAAMIGASKDAVASWETGRSRLSRPYARRIALATGVEEDSLRRGRSPLTTYIPFKGHPPFTAETFAAHRESYWGRSDETAARQHLKHCADALGLIFLAAAKPAGAKRPCRLPAVVDSFIQWCQQTREDFHLAKDIDSLLDERRAKLVLTHSYREWRRMQKEDPTVCRMMGFKDDPTKRDEESLPLEGETSPLWLPGRPMRAPAG